MRESTLRNPGRNPGQVPVCVRRTGWKQALAGKTVPVPPFSGQETGGEGLQGYRQRIRRKGDHGGISPAVLNERLRELREGRLVELGEGEGFGLSPLGRELLAGFSPIVGWADRWARTVSR